MSMDKYYKLTIVTICYNSGNLIKPTIESVLSQSFKNFEYVIIDGASSDNTLEIVESFRLQFESLNIPLRVYSEKDTGIYNAMNKGIFSAVGEWINFMNAGDSFYAKDTLEKVFAIQHDADVLSGSALRVFEGHTDIWNPKPIKNMWRRMPFCHQSTFVKTSYHKQRLFDETFRVGADYDFFFDSYYYQNKKFLYLDIMVARYDMTGLSTVNYMNDAKENLKLSLKYKALPSILYFLMRITYRATLRPYILSRRDKRRKLALTKQ